MLVSLPMYDLPELRAATDAFWRGLARHLRARGFTEAPEALTRSGSPEADASDPALLFSQVCGMTLAGPLSGRLRVVAAPSYGAPGCAPGLYRSLLVVREESRAASVAELRGGTCAINEEGSHSGKNALRAHVADLAGGRPFFSAVRRTGAHVESLAAVGRGEVDVAAIDCVTHALVARVRPSLLRGTRVLGATDAAPAPPFVTSRKRSEAELAALRGALEDALADSSLAAARRALLLEGALVPPEGESRYACLLELERAASAAGCGELAPP